MPRRKLFGETEPLGAVFTTALGGFLYTIVLILWPNMVFHAIQSVLSRQTKQSSFSV